MHTNTTLHLYYINYIIPTEARFYIRVIYTLICTITFNYHNNDYSEKRTIHTVHSSRPKSQQLVFKQLQIFKILGNIVNSIMII